MQPVSGCRAPAKGSFQLGNNAFDATKDKLSWKWVQGAATTAAEFGDPVNGGTAYNICVYDEAANVPRLVLSATAPAGDTCANGKPCWKRTGRATPTGFAYSDALLTPNGLRTITLRAGDAGKAKIVVTGKGANLRVPTLPLQQQTRVIVQLVKSDGGACWESVYPAPASKNTTDQFKDVLP